MIKTGTSKIAKKLAGVVPPVPISDATFKKQTKVFEDYTKLGPLPVSAEKLLEKYKGVSAVPTLLGVEVEVENIHKDSLVLPEYLQCKTEGSLRNGGVEIITSPLTPSQSMYAVCLLWQHLAKLAANEPDFSWRTSVHVHLNVLDLTEEEFQKLLILSFIFEPLLFTVAGKDREESIFCVPLTQSTASFNLRSYLLGQRSLGEFLAHSQKYSAVNLFRMIKQPHHNPLGTVEYRHLGGTNEVKKILLWQSLILQLFGASVAIPMEGLKAKIMELNTSSKYMDFVHSVFTPSVANSLSLTDWPVLFSGTISRAKEFFVKNPKIEFKADSAMGSFVKKVYEEKMAKNAKKKDPFEKTAKKLSAAQLLSMGQAELNTHVQMQQQMHEIHMAALNANVAQAPVPAPAEQEFTLPPDPQAEEDWLAELLTNEPSEPQW